MTSQARETTNDVGDLTWDEVERRLANGALAILPVGAGAKEHGFHLPMRTDEIQARFLAGQLAERFDALIWPVLTYGYYPAFVDYTGSCSLSRETFVAVVRELLAGLLGYEARGVVVLNTGISTLRPIDEAIAAHPEKARILHLKIHDGTRYRAAAARLADQNHGGHADELETSRMLVIARDRVMMDRAEASSDAPPGPGPMQRRDPLRPNYSRSGSIGDPTRATAEKGAALFAAMIEDMIDTLGRWRR